jgi:DNA primase
MDIRDFSDGLLRKSDIYKRVIEVCNNLMFESKYAINVRDYFISRGISNNGDFYFGYFPENIYLKELIKYVSVEDLLECGLIYKKVSFDSGHQQVLYNGVLNNHNLIMPYKNLYGDIIGLVGRSILSDQERKDKGISKYKNTSLLKGINLFGLSEAKWDILKRDSVIIVEGQFDCISCHNNGFRNTVALGGAAFTKFHFQLINRFTKNIYLILDNDNAGNRETEKILKRYSNISNIVPVPIPECYKDIDEYFKNNNDKSLLFLCT